MCLSRWILAGQWTRPFFFWAQTVIYGKITNFYTDSLRWIFIDTDISASSGMPSHLIRSAVLLRAWGESFTFTSFRIIPQKIIYGVLSINPDNSCSQHLAISYAIIFYYTIIIYELSSYGADLAIISPDFYVASNEQTIDAFLVETLYIVILGYNNDPGEGVPANLLGVRICLHRCIILSSGSDMLPFLTSFYYLIAVAHRCTHTHFRHICTVEQHRGSLQTMGTLKFNKYLHI